MAHDKNWSFDTKNPLLKAFQIGSLTATKNYPYEQIGPFFRSQLKDWDEEATLSLEIGLPEPKFQEINRRYYNGIIMKLAGCTYNLLNNDRGEFTIFDVFRGLKETSKIENHSKKNLSECSREYYQYKDEYSQKVVHKYNDAKKGTLYHQPSADEITFLDGQKKATLAIFRAASDEEFKNPSQDLTNFIADIHAVLTPKQRQKQANYFASLKDKNIQRSIAGLLSF